MCNKTGGTKWNECLKRIWNCFENQ